MAARPITIAGAPVAEVHLLPALVEHNGPASVSSYFRPQLTETTVDGLTVLSASLRGRILAGVQLPLPEGYSGAVLEFRQQEVQGPRCGCDGGEDDVEAAAAATSRPGWVATGTFSHLHYFNHDAAPLRGDGLRRCLEWAELAVHLHASTDPAAVVAAVAAEGPAPS